MTDYVVLDEVHLSICVPKDLDDDVCDAMRQILESPRFRAALRRGSCQVVRQYPEIAPVRIRISV